MHLKDDFLRAYIDRELSNGQMQLVKEHLTRCPACAQRLEGVRERVDRVHGVMANMAPSPREMPRSPRTAYQRFQRVRKEPVIPMNNKRLWSALAVLVVLVLVFTITPASAWASSFLSLFRVERVQVISFNPEAMQRGQGAMSGQREVLQQLFENNLEVSNSGEPQTVASAAEAAQLAGYTPRVLDQEGQVELPKLYFRPETVAKFTIDQPRMQAVLDAAEIKAQLPESVDGKVITLTMPNTVVASYGVCPEEGDPSEAGMAAIENCTVLMQLPSPTVDTPAGIDVQKMGEAIFIFLGMSEQEAREMSSRIDWASTLVLPIPQDEGIKSQEVQVDGVMGTLLVGDAIGVSTTHYSLIWSKDGMLYMLSGPGGKEAALEAASTLK